MDGVLSPSPSSPSASLDYKVLIQAAIDANKEHQIALTQHAERLYKELRELDTLIEMVDAEEEDEGELLPEIRIPGAQKPSGPCRVSEFLNPNSPFYEDASRRTSFLQNTTCHPRQ